MKLEIDKHSAFKPYNPGGNPEPPGRELGGPSDLARATEVQQFYTDPNRWLQVPGFTGQSLELLHRTLNVPSIDGQLLRLEQIGHVQDPFKRRIDAIGGAEQAGLLNVTGFNQFDPLAVNISTISGQAGPSGLNFISPNRQAGPSSLYQSFISPNWGQIGPPIFVSPNIGPSEGFLGHSLQLPTEDDDPGNISGVSEASVENNVCGRFDPLMRVYEPPTQYNFGSIDTQIATLMNIWQSVQPKITRKHFSEKALKVLEDNYTVKHNPEPQKVEEIAFSINDTPKRVRQWFKTRRGKDRRKQK